MLFGTDARFYCAAGGTPPGTLIRFGDVTELRVVAPMSGPGVQLVLAGMAISLFEDQARREAEIIIARASGGKLAVVGRIPLPQ